jgi:hypothetical protein
MLKTSVIKALAVSVALLGLAGAGEHVIEVAAADQCRQQCQAVENQCRMQSKDLDSSKCTAKFLACIANCRKR